MDTPSGPTYYLPLNACLGETCDRAARPKTTSSDLSCRRGRLRPPTGHPDNQRDVRGDVLFGETREQHLKTAYSPAFRVFTAAIVIVCYAIAIPLARAADNAGSFVAFSFGNQTCVAWSDARQKKDTKAIRMEAWALGFVTSYNKYVHDGINVLEEMQNDDLFAALDQHCRDRRRHNLSFAINALIERARKEKKPDTFDGLMDLFRSKKRGK